MLKRFMVAAMFLVALAGSAFAEKGLPIDSKDCLGCHGDKINVERFAKSVHGQNGCNSCHVELLDLKKHMTGEQMPGKVNCVRCHKKIETEYSKGVHAYYGVGCAKCHTDIHEHNYWKGDKTTVVKKCIQCHDKKAEFTKSVHGIAIFKGKTDAAACHDCHGLHSIEKLGAKGGHKEKEFHTKVCLKCHGDEEMMARNGMSTIQVKSYFDSYHGKNYKLDSPERVAGCADCHMAHSVLPPSNEASSVNQKNLVGTCAQCHKKATALFVKFYAHGEHGDRDHYPILYCTFMAMTSLLVGTFAVFWVHTLLWLVRGFIENRRLLADQHNGEKHHHVPNGGKQYRRFRRIHVFMHLLVITSFLGLSLTGLPLKFNDQAWALAMMKFYGGTANAGFIHRICAGITFVYFGIALAMSANFLFFSKKVKGTFLQRLFGPESLCPNLRDLTDVIGMVKWFVGKGQKPTFDRWTYWEKFDFLAVFWGMFAIGGSGLMLWFPEIFGCFLPGWAFNVATIIHSDEALLATGFIFTVHFFNTHGRPEKFPMDFVIFNGQISKEEFLEERGDQWKRYEKDGILPEIEAKKVSGALYDFVLKSFGFLAVAIGLSLVVLMIFAFMGK